MTLQRTYTVNVPPNALADFLHKLYPHELGGQRWELIGASVTISDHLCLKLSTPLRVEAKWEEPDPFAVPAAAGEKR